MVARFIVGLTHEEIDALVKGWTVEPKPDLFSGAKRLFSGTKRQSRMTTESSVPVRALGASEEYFWLSSQNSAKHFVLTAAIIGSATLEQWSGAFEAVQRRHPLLRVSITEDAKGVFSFCELQNVPISLTAAPAGANESWQEEIARQLATPFPSSGSLLVRASLLHTPETTYLTLVLHHAIADGLAATLVLRDLLVELGGSRITPLSVPPSQDSLASALVPASAQAAPAHKAVSERQAAAFLSEPRSLPTIRSLRLTPKLTTAVRACARRQGTTVHGALSAALVLAGRAVSSEWRNRAVRVVSPVSNRPVLNLGEQCVLSIVFPSGDYCPESTDDFWSTARSVTQDLSEVRTPAGLKLMLSGFEQLISSKPGVAGIAAFELQAADCEMMVSNLGEIAFPEKSGDFALQAVWGPAVFIGLEGEQMIGAATLNGALHLLHSSYRPLQSLLENAQAILTGACREDLLLETEG